MRNLVYIVLEMQNRLLLISQLSGILVELKSLWNVTRLSMVGKMDIKHMLLSISLLARDEDACNVRY